MKLGIPFVLGATVLLAGCLPVRQQIGASATRDNDVLTGGPIRGTTLADVPQPVKAAIVELAPDGEVADIDKTRRDGQVVYRVAFVERGINPKIYVTENGFWVTDARQLDRALEQERVFQHDGRRGHNLWVAESHD